MCERQRRHARGPPRPAGVLFAGATDGARPVRHRSTRRLPCRCAASCQEAGVKIDLVAGQGIGAGAAALAAIDGGARLWEPDGLWRSPSAQASTRGSRCCARRVDRPSFWWGCCSSRSWCWPPAPSCTRSGSCSRCSAWMPAPGSSRPVPHGCSRVCRRRAPLSCRVSRWPLSRGWSPWPGAERLSRVGGGRAEAASAGGWWWELAARRSTLSGARRAFPISCGP